MKKQLLKAMTVAAMYATATGANAQNSLYGWGSSGWGALGNGATFGTVSSPTQTGTANWKFVDGGLGFSVGMQSDGTLWSWGQNGSDYQLGDGTTTDKTTPVQISTGMDWKTLSVGQSHTLILKNDHTLWGFGDGNSGAFGTGSATSLSTPTQIGGGTADWEAVAGGNNFTLAIKTNGTLWGWGKNSYGQIGNGSTGADVYSPVQIGTDTDWKMVAASGKNNSFAIKTDGTLWAWGYNSFGGLIVNTPTQVGTDNNWKIVATLDDSHYAIKTDGTLWAWGDNIAGQLGIGNNSNTTTITQVGTDNDWESVAPEADAAIMMKTNHTIWGAGQAIYNGISPVANTNAPVQIGTDNLWTFIAAGYTQAFALKGSTTGITGNTVNSSITMYPNPAVETLHIKTSISTEYITLSNAVGRTVYSGNAAEINVAGFSSGIYYYMVSLKNGERISGKFSKQ